MIKSDVLRIFQVFRNGYPKISGLVGASGTISGKRGALGNSRRFVRQPGLEAPHGLQRMAFAHLRSMERNIRELAPLGSSDRQDQFMPAALGQSFLGFDFSCDAERFVDANPSRERREFFIRIRFHRPVSPVLEE